MIANYENRSYQGDLPLWAGTYRPLNNLPHWHREAEVIYLREGQASIGVNGEVFQAGPGALFFCGGGDIHFTASQKDASLSMLIFDPALARPILQGYRLASPRCTCGIDFASYFHKISRLLLERGRFYEQEAAAHLTLFVAELFRLEACGPAAGEKDRYLLGQYQALLDYIDGNYATVCFEEALSIMRFSPSYFSKMFAALSGMTFTRYVNTVRIEKAIALLKEGGQTVTCVATACGFSSIRHFNRIFRELTGITPKEVSADFVFHNPPVRIRREHFNPTLADSRLVQE